MRKFDPRAQQNRELWLIRQAAPKLRDDRPVRLHCDPRPGSNPALSLDSRLPLTDWNGPRARAREQFARLFTLPAANCQLSTVNSDVQR